VAQVTCASHTWHSKRSGSWRDAYNHYWRRRSRN